MKQFQTRAIVLKRLDYQEADRILTVLSEDHGKFSTMARGARKGKSRLAGGIELFTVNDIVVIEGRGDIMTLRSSRMHSHFPNITRDYPRLQVGYSFLQAVDKITEAASEDDYFTLLEQALMSLNDLAVDTAVTELWFYMQLLTLQGRQPDFTSDSTGHKLVEDESYHLNWTEGHLQLGGPLQAEHIKLARLVFRLSPQQLTQVKNCAHLAQAWLKQLPALATH